MFSHCPDDEELSIYIVAETEKSLNSYIKPQGNNWWTVYG